jgi:hypothetical protein
MANARQAVLTVGGFAVGAFFGNPALGFTIGSALGQGLFPETPPGGPGIDDSIFNGASFGAPIIRTYGRDRVATQLIWGGDVRVEEGGGKGGGGKAPGPQEAYATFAMALGRGPICGIRKLWLNSELFYSVDDESSLEEVAASLKLKEGVTLYLGTEDQEPDPTIQADVGESLTPAYRGIAYIVFRDLPLAQFGNRLPNITAEVVGTGEDEVLEFPISDWPDLSDSYPVTSRDSVFRLSEAQRSQEDSGRLIVETVTVGLEGNVLTRGHDVYQFEEKFCDPGETRTFVVTILRPITNRPGAAIGRINFSCGVTLPGINDSSTVYLAWLDYFPNVGESLEIEGARLGFLGPAGSTQVAFAAEDPEAPNTIYLIPGSGAQNPENTLYVVTFGGSTPIRSHSYTGDDLVWNVAFDERYYYALVGPDGTTEKQIYAYDRQSGSQVHHWTGIPAINRPWMAREGACTMIAEQTTQGRYRVLDLHDDDTYDVLAYDSIDAGFGKAVHPVSIPGAMLTSGGLFTCPVCGPGEITLGSVVSAICEENGLATSDIDVTELTKTIHGYSITRQMSGRQAIDPLRAAHFFDAVESGGKLRFPLRGSEPVATITEEDLAAHTEGSQRPPVYALERGAGRELPKTVRVHYKDAGNAYERAQQLYQRIEIQSEASTDIEYAGALGNTEAAQIADIIAHEAYWSRNELQFSLPLSYIYLDPGDAVNLQISGVTRRVRVVEINYRLPGVLNVRALRDDASIYESAAVGGDTPEAGQAVPLAGPTQLMLLELPARSRQNDSAGVELGARAFYAGWSYASVQLSRNASQYEPLAFLGQRAVNGVVSTAVAASNPDVWDRGTVITVDMRNGTLAGLPEDDVLQNGNLAAYGKPGRWELLNFADAADQGGGEYEVSNLLRGRWGTEWAMDLHEDGDDFVLVDSRVVREQIDENDIGNTLYYRAVSNGNVPENADVLPAELEGVALKPYSPVHLRAVHDGDLAIECIRRTRYGGEWRDGADVALNESSLQIEFDIADDSGTVVRTISATSESANYTSAQMAEDFDPGTHDITITAYQISDVVGRGYASDPLAVEITV